MQIHFKGTNYEIPTSVSAHARKKLGSLRKHLGRARHAAYAYVDMGRETGAHQNGKIWYADINLDADGARFYARALEESVEAAIDKATAEIVRELQSARRREQSLVRKGGMLFKNLIRRAQA